MLWASRKKNRFAEKNLEGRRGGEFFTGKVPSHTLTSFMASGNKNLLQKHGKTANFAGQFRDLLLPRTGDHCGPIGKQSNKRNLNWLPLLFEERSCEQLLPKHRGLFLRSGDVRSSQRVFIRQVFDRS